MLRPCNFLTLILLSTVSNTTKSLLDGTPLTNLNDDTLLSAIIISLKSLNFPFSYVDTPSLILCPVVFMMKLLSVIPIHSLHWVKKLLLITVQLI